LNPQVARRSTAEKKRISRGLVKTFSATAAGFLVAALFFGRYEEQPTNTTPNSNPRLVQNESNSGALASLNRPTPNVEEAFNEAKSVPLKGSSIASVEVDGLERSRLNNVVEVKLNCPEQGLANVTIPCTECDRFDRVGFLTSNLEVPPNVAEELQRTGGRVTSHRDERRFQLGDGRVLIIPVDTYNVNYDANLQVH